MSSDPQPTVEDGQVSVTLGCADFATYDLNSDNELVLQVTIRDNTIFDYQTGTGPWIRLNEDPTGQNGHDYNRFSVTWNISNDVADLWIQDRVNDTGLEDTQASISWPLDDAPGIWITNQQNGPIETPDYSLNTVYTYVEVKNRGCADFVADGRTVEMHYTPSIAQNSAFLPNNPPLNGFIEIGTEQIPNVAVGASETVEIEWPISNVPPEDIPPTETLCLLARIYSNNR